MNLIEQLGGYESAKQIIQQNIEDFGGECGEVGIYHKNTGWIVHEDLQSSLLEYRRENSIFEVGDVVAEPNLTYPYLYKIYEISGLLIKVENSTNNRKSISFCSVIRHATDKEIKFGHRL